MACGVNNRDGHQRQRTQLIIKWPPYWITQAIATATSLVEFRGGPRSWSGVDIPEGERTPLTPPPRASSSLGLRASSWSAVTRAEAANRAVAWSNVLDCWGRRKLLKSLMRWKKWRKNAIRAHSVCVWQPKRTVGYWRVCCLQWRCCWLAVAAGSAPAAVSASGPAAPDAAGTVRLWQLRETRGLLQTWE